METGFDNIFGEGPTPSHSAMAGERDMQQVKNLQATLERGSTKKMLESRPEDALVKLVKLVNFVKLVKLVKPWRLY